MRRIVFLVFLLLFITGCNYLRTFPLYSEVRVEHPENILLFNDYFANLMEKSIKENRLDLHSVKIYSKLKERILNYLSQKKDINENIILALKEFKVIRGMNTSEVALVLGKPTKKIELDNNNESWIYLGDRSGVEEWDWYYKWGKAIFQNGILTDIEIQTIDIYK
ncbi:MAG: hypothetical protein AB1472_04325 [Candidatus Omnitrophota bacterium]